MFLFIFIYFCFEDQRSATEHILIPIFGGLEASIVCTVFGGRRVRRAFVAFAAGMATVAFFALTAVVSFMERKAFYTPLPNRCAGGDV